MFPRTDSRDGRKMPPRTYRFPDVPDCETLGLHLAGTDENGEEPEHDHASRDHREGYPLASRLATPDEEETEGDLPKNETLRVGPGETCRLHAGGDGAQVVVAEAP
jgi:hypothetical protein